MNNSSKTPSNHCQYVDSNPLGNVFSSLYSQYKKKDAKHNLL